MPDQLGVRPDTEVRTKAIGASVVIAAVGFSVLAFGLAIWHLYIDETNAGLLREEATRPIVQAQLSSMTTTVAATFGALTTFLGTAVGAYFGISAAQSSVKSLSQSLENSTGGAQLQQNIDSASKQLDQLKNDPEMKEHVDKLETVKALLS